MKTRLVSFSEAISRLPAPGGKPSAEVFKHGNLVVKIFAPRGEDTQKPHSRDEIYVVVRGSGEFVNGDLRFKFGPGDVLFAATGEVHRFERFSDDFATWVIFYGPEGGERDG